MAFYLDIPLRGNNLVRVIFPILFTMGEVQQMKLIRLVIIVTHILDCYNRKPSLNREETIKEIEKCEHCDIKSDEL